MSSKAKELPHKKTGQPLIIGEELDAQLQQYVELITADELAC